MGRGADGPPPGPSGRGPDPPSIFRPERDWKGHNTTHQQVQLKARGRMLRLVDFNRLFLTYHPEIVLCCITGGGSMFRTGDEELDAIAESTRVGLTGQLRRSLTQLLVRTSRKKLMDSYEQDGPPLGSGAFSVVVPVRHRITGKQYAAKVIKVGGPKMEKRVRAALAEAAAHNLLHHQAFVSMFEVYVEREGIMELCGGGTLLSHVQNAVDAKAARASRAQQAEGIYGALSEADARIVFSRLAAALAYLHDHCQMVHRDVKLENVLVDKGGALGSVRLADFGFTVPVVNPKTRGVIESGLKGTLEYASPEVLVAYLEPGGDASDASRRPPVDMFSLGVTLFIMLGGYHLFDGEFGSKAVDARNTAPARLEREFSKSFWREVSGEAKDLVRRLLHPAPGMRLTAAQAVAHTWVQRGAPPRLETSSAPLFSLSQLWGPRDGARSTLSSPAAWLGHSPGHFQRRKPGGMARIPVTPLEAGSDAKSVHLPPRPWRESAGGGAGQYAPGAAPSSSSAAGLTREGSNATNGTAPGGTSWMGPRTPPRPGGGGSRQRSSAGEAGVPFGSPTRQGSTAPSFAAVGSPGARGGSVATTSRDTATNGLGRMSGLEGRADREKPALRSPTSAFQMRRANSLQGPGETRV